VIGAGPEGLVAAKHALEAGFDVSVFEASDDRGGQWNTTATHSGTWPGMRATRAPAPSRIMPPVQPTRRIVPRRGRRPQPVRCSLPFAVDGNTLDP
jgi:monoamine oxidase